MSADSIATVRRIYEGWANGETAYALGSLIDPDIEIHPDPESAWPGIEPCYCGYDGINRYLASIYGAFRHTAHIWTLRDARAVRLDVNWDRERAFADVGLPPERAPSP